MNDDATININGPRTITFAPEALALVIDALSEMPFRRANPVIQEIFTQLRKQDAENGAPTPGIPVTDSPDNPAGGPLGNTGKRDAKTDGVSGPAGRKIIKN